VIPTALNALISGKGDVLVAFRLTAIQADPAGKIVSINGGYVHVDEDRFSAINLLTGDGDWQTRSKSTQHPTGICTGTQKWTA
jgi:hypothetical protein